MADDWYCPHCALPIAQGPVCPPKQKCPECRLIIGAGRATQAPSTEAGERSHSAAAGILRGRLVRSGEGEARDRDDVVAILSEVATRNGLGNLGRLKMLDYAKHAEEDPSLPSVADVLATFGGWKAATRTSPEARALRGGSSDAAGSAAA